MLRNTEAHARTHAQHRDELAALRAQILWANPETVVVAECYKDDEPNWPRDRKNHMKVCKPDRDYPDPQRFVETGSPRRAHEFWRAPLYCGA